MVSLYLAPADSGELAHFMPGQHLLFKLDIPGQQVPVFRYYSFSDVFNPEYYRVSVKKEPSPRDKPLAPPGLASNYLCDFAKVGDVLEAKGPSGAFCLNPMQDGTPVLIAGGIGITPLLCMAKSIAELNPARTVYFFYGVNERNDHAFEKELDKISKGYPNIRISTFYNKIVPGDIKGVNYDFEGYINIDTILGITGELHRDYYICGPAVMMNYLTGALEELGVDKQNINIESFNSANNEGTGDNFDNKSLGEPGELLVEFLKSGRKIKWDKRYRSILEFAEGNDVEINSG